jgi:hypothetical protein
VRSTAAKQGNAEEGPISFDGSICSLRYISVLRRANFPADDLEEATRDLEHFLDWYSTAQAVPRNSEFAAELRFLSKSAKQLLDAVGALSSRASREVRYEAYKLQTPLWAFYARTTVALNKTPPDKGGQRMKSEKLDLAFRVAILWRRTFPIDKTITRTSAGGYRGPVLDFVKSVLKLERVRFQSSNALGKHLYEMRTISKGKVGTPCSLIDEKARLTKRGS